MTDNNAFGVGSGTDSAYHLNTTTKVPLDTQSRPINAKTGKRVKVNKETKGGLSIPPSSVSAVV